MKVNWDQYSKYIHGQLIKSGCHSALDFSPLTHLDSSARLPCRAALGPSDLPEDIAHGQHQED